MDESSQTMVAFPTLGHSEKSPCIAAGMTPKGCGGHYMGFCTPHEDNETGCFAYESESSLDDLTNKKIDAILDDFHGQKVYSAACMDNEVAKPIEYKVMRQIVDDENPDMPIMMVDVERIVSQWKRWQRLIPRARPYYPIKCNDEAILIRILHALGAGFDCASPAEMRTVLAIGCPPEDIIYSNPCKQVTGLTFAQSRNVTKTVFDNIDELYKIAEVMPEAELLLRIRCNDSGAQCPMSCKFGAGREAWGDLLETTVELNLNLWGVHFHVGSGAKTVDAYKAAVEDAAAVFAMAKEYGIEMSILDIGGGFPGEPELKGDETERPQITFEEIAHTITPLIDQYFDPKVEVMSEPGRYFAMTSHTLAVKVFSRRVGANLAKRNSSNSLKCEKVVEKEKTGGEIRATNDVEKPKVLYYINDGLYGSFNCVVYDHAKIVPEILKSKRNEKSRDCITKESAGDFSDKQSDLYPSTLFGQTCDGFDCILDSVGLPLLEVGDWLIFRHMGAYTVAAASTFNGFSKPDTRYVRIHTFE